MLEHDSGLLKSGVLVLFDELESRILRDIVLSGEDEEEEFEENIREISEFCAILASKVVISLSIRVLESAKEKKGSQVVKQKSTSPHDQ